MAAVIYRAYSVTNSRFSLEVNSAYKDDTVLHLEVIDNQEQSVNGVELTKDDVGELIEHLQKQYKIMED